MALQELSPPPPITGFATLGNAIAQAGNDYRVRGDQLQDAARLRQQQLDDAARNRANQLSDVQSERTYLDTEGDKRRREAIEDKAKMLKVENRADGIKILENEGYLNPRNEDNDQAIDDARSRFQSDGLDKQYVALFTTPDENGHPLLLHREATNPALVQAAKDKLSSIQAKATQAAMTQPGNAQFTVNDLMAKLNKEQSEADAISTQLSQPPRNYLLGDPEVRALAVQLAESSKLGSGKDRAVVASLLPEAQKQLNTTSFVQHNDNIQAWRTQLQDLRYKQTTTTQALKEAIAASHTYPSPGGNGAPSSVPPLTLGGGGPPPLQVAPSAAIQSAMSSIVGGNNPPPAPPTGAPAPSPLIENPTNDPIIAAGNSAIAGADKQDIQNNLNAAIQDGQKIDNLLKMASTAISIPGGVDPEESPSLPSPDPIGGAQQTASLLKQKADNDAKIKALQAQLQGPVPAGVTPPSINTASSFTPSPAFASPAVPPLSLGGNWWQSQPQNQ